MARPVTDTRTMSRLAFVRLLYLQGVDQSRRPEPLSFTSVLTFHDTVEQFLILAAEHLHAPPLGRDGGFMDYWSALRPSRNFADGVELSGKIAMGRLNEVRRVFKHAGGLPGSEAVHDAVAAVAGFLEDNTPRVFAIEFDSIDMADVVPQEHARAQLKAAAAAELAGDRTEAMAQLAEAFAELFSAGMGRGLGSGAYGFGRTVTSQPFLGVSAMFNTIASSVHQNRRRRVAALGEKLGRHIDQLTEAVEAMQRGMRVIATGIEYARYNRFEALTPTVYGSGEHRHIQAVGGYAPSREEFEYCQQFVITVALRMAELEAHSAAPSWRPARDRRGPDRRHRGADLTGPRTAVS